MNIAYNEQYYIYEKSNKLASVLLFSTLFLIIVFPNAFREIKIVLLLVSTLTALTDFSKIDKNILLFYLLGIIWTTLYILIGLEQAKAPDVSTPQILLVYIISPLLWIINSNYILLRYSLKTIIKCAIVFLLVGCITVFAGIWLFDHGYINILEYIIENPNKVFTDEGFFAIRFHVYGSFIFLIPATIQLYSQFNKKWIYFLIILLALATSFISGRDAVILSVFVGGFMLIILNGYIKIKYLVYGLFIAAIIWLTLSSLGLNLSLILEMFVNKIKEGGQSARVGQFYALTEGINDNILGAGHGVGVNYLRSHTFPWRYEILPLATIYRVSFIGLFIYAIPFLYIIRKYIKMRMMQSSTIYDNFFLAGITSFILANFTNPYLESFEFQIFYFFTAIYFYYRPLPL